MLFHVTAFCNTHGRHICLERVVKCFLDQDYGGPHSLFIYSTGSLYDQKIVLPELPSNKKVILYNEIVPFTSVGEKFSRGLDKLVELFHPDIVTHFDDDDIFLPNHITEGVVGMHKAYAREQLAYKPKQSYFRTMEGITETENVLEPSIFVDTEWLKREGYNTSVSVKYHQKWLDPLTEQDLILVDTEGASTFIYNWGDAWGVFKLSGSGIDDSKNFEDHKVDSQNWGDYIIIPNEDNSNYYNEVNFCKQ